jgi:hypothetical protein
MSGVVAERIDVATDAVSDSLVQRWPLVNGPGVVNQPELVASEAAVV